VHAEAEWLRQQIELPQALYTVGELSRMSGTEPDRLIRYLRSKRVIQKASRGVKYEIELAVLIELAPEFWRTIQQRVARAVA